VGQAPAARLRRVRFRSESNNEVLRQLAHEPDADARRITLVTRESRSACDEPPRAVRQDQRPAVTDVVERMQLVH